METRITARVTTEAVWADLHDRLFLYIRRRVSTDQDAEDILSDVFLRIHAKRRSLAEARNVTGWTFRIASNAVTDYYRARAKASDAEAQLAREALVDSSPGIGDRTVNQEAPSRGAELAACMEPLLGQLPARYREAIALTELDGVTQSEAASKLGLSTSGMKSRVQRGRARLKILLLDCCHVELDRRGAVLEFGPRKNGPACGCDSAVAR